MEWFSKNFSRRDMLKGMLVFGSAVSLNPRLFDLISPFESDKYGRVCVPNLGIYSRPSIKSEKITTLYEDDVTVWLREVVGEIPPGMMNAAWVETPDGFIYGPNLQPVEYLENDFVTELPQTSLGEGFWAEVTFPFVDLILDNPPPSAPWLKQAENPRFYYSQVVWVDGIKKENETESYYRINERFGYGDIFWANSKAFRKITDDELQPISPQVENKRVFVDVTPSRQYLVCLEDEAEVYYCKISSGAKWNSEGQLMETWGTPQGVFRTWRKQISSHMTGGAAGGGWDIPGVGWTVLFSSNGVAIHSTFWHNDFGTPRSRGCVNVKPKDAQWIFRWTNPLVLSDPGDITIPMPGGTQIEVREY